LEEGVQFDSLEAAKAACILDPNITIMCNQCGKLHQESDKYKYDYSTNCFSCIQSFRRAMGIKTFRVVPFYYLAIRNPNYKALANAKDCWNMLFVWS
jgi:hypothetical protein